MAEFKPITWTFFGRVLPDMPSISMELPSGMSQTTLGFSYELSGRIHNSKLMATVRQLDPVDILTLRNLVASDIQGSVDLAGLIVGAGLDVELISANADDGAWQYFDAFVPALGIVGTLDLPTDLIIASGADIPSRIMLGDFREAIRVPVQTGFYCYRAIEAGMQTFKNQPLEKDGKAWEKFRDQLHIDKAAIDRVKGHADWARHGRDGSISDHERLIVLQITQKIIKRYLDFIASGRAALNSDSYPQIV